VGSGKLVLLLSGPSGSGKSTAAGAWADSRTETTAWIDCDAVRGFIRAGYARPDVSFDDEAERQWMLAARISAHMAHAYIEERIRCVLDVVRRGTSPASPASRAGFVVDAYA
jgi:adenylylsulfate kinase-like enzyme